MSTWSEMSISYKASKILGTQTHPHLALLIQLLAVCERDKEETRGPRRCACVCIYTWSHVPGQGWVS